ncbi:hypothetical protein [Pseudoxanthomonas sp.]|jgi:hypothetical protein|uniref:hypothetical protein n=1 Tax=Pseudoxanthomonas sp. TaxID=1871049 RepID=UPI002FE2A33F
MVQDGDFSVFEYVYRDAGNWKTYGIVLLTGFDQSAEARILESLGSGKTFVAEQVSIPALCQKHWKDCGDGPSDMDHAFHEFVCLRLATIEDRESFRVETTLASLLERFSSAAGRWDVRLSPNCFL